MKYVPENPIINFYDFTFSIGCEKLKFIDISSINLNFYF